MSRYPVPISFIVVSVDRYDESQNRERKTDILCIVGDSQIKYVDRKLSASACSRSCFPDAGTEEAE